MKDLNNLNLRLQHGNPKEKSWRTMRDTVRDMASHLNSYPTDQMIDVFKGILSNCKRDKDILIVDTTDPAIECLKTLKGNNSSLGKDVRAIICLCKERYVRSITRDQRRELGIYGRDLRYMDEIRDFFDKGDFRFLKREQSRRKSRGMRTALPKLAEDFLDECSTPIKFSKKGLRVLHFPFRHIHRLFLEKYAEEIEDAGGFSLHYFRKCRQERHLDCMHASLYNCPVHVLAQNALTSAKAFLMREHIPARCNERVCLKCEYIEKFPETTHNFVNQKLKNCRPQNPDLKCIDNECEKCRLDEDSWLQDQFEEAGFDLSQENFQNKENLVYAKFDTDEESNYKVTELRFHRDKENVSEVLTIWSNQLSNLPAHQHEQWRIAEVIKSLTADEEPELPANSCLAHIDYQENIEISQDQMIAAQRFGKKKVAAFTQVVDIPWENIDCKQNEKPEPKDTPWFKNNICRLSFSHFCKESTKHNAQTAVQSLEILIDVILSQTKNTDSLLITCDGSPKEFCNSHFLALVTELSAKITEKLGKTFTIAVIFHAAYHGNTPCDAEQRVVKSTNDIVGANSATFSVAIESLEKALNSATGQPDPATSKVYRRAAQFVPAVDITSSVWKSLPKTRLSKIYWCTGEQHVMLRRRFPCLEDCCTIDKQSEDCKFTERFGEIEEVELERDPSKVVHSRSRSSKRVASQKKSPPARARTVRRRVQSQPGRRQGRSKKA